MPLINGTLTDFGLDPLTANDPVLQFRASAAGSSGLNILVSTKPVEVTPAANGFFEVELASTEDITPGGIYYLITAQYRESGTGYVKREQLPWHLTVPTAGGALADLLAVPSNPAQVYIGTDEPTNPSPGTWWMNPDTGDLMEWS